MILDICLSPALYPFYKKENDTVIVVDIFRACTTICAAFANGASAIIPVADIEEAKQYKLRGYPVGAERNTRKCDFADFGNSPFDYTQEKVKGKEIVFTTTNGTNAIEQSRGCKTLLIGAFSNINALAKMHRNRRPNSSGLCRMEQQNEHGRYSFRRALPKNFSMKIPKIDRCSENSIGIGNKT